jgi:hypothetical protein
VQIRRWPPYAAARGRLGAAELAALESQEADWVSGLVVAEFDGELSSYARGILGRVGWIELPEFRVLARLTLDEGGSPSQLRLFDLKRR